MSLKSLQRTMCSIFTRMSPLLLGGLLGFLASYGTAFAAGSGDINTLVVDVVNMMRNVGGPLAGVVAAVCLVMMVVSKISGNAQAVSNWKNGAIVAFVGLLFLVCLPALVDWAVSIGDKMPNNSNTQAFEPF